MPKISEFNRFWNNGTVDKLKTGLAVAQFAIILVLSIAAFFIRAELSQIHHDRETIAELREFMAETRGNRFTASDGLKVYQEIAKIREEMAKMPTEVPPQWFKDLVEEIKSQGDRTQMSVDQLKSAVLKNGVELGHLQTEVADLRRTNGT